jgi:hypothetical protein
LLYWNLKNKPPLTAGELKNELMPKAQVSYREGLAHANHVHKLTSARLVKKSSLRNKVVAYVKGSGSRGATVSEVTSYVHGRAEAVRAIVAALQRDGWIRVQPKRRGHIVVWTGAGKIRSSVEHHMYGDIRKIQPWKTRRRRRV